MLRLYGERARLCDGQTVLDLGCGGGSLAFYLGEKYPNSHITAVSHSKTQKAYIGAERKRRGIANLEVITADMNVFTTAKKFDRILSIEMLEHIRNYEKLFEKLAALLNPGGLFFVHIFSHAQFAYPFEVKDASDGMSQYFFTGGSMPSDALRLYFQKDLRVLEHWRVPGTHDARTADAWRRNMDRHESEIKALFAQVYEAGQVTRWWIYWRVFFLACYELSNLWRPIPRISAALSATYACWVTERNSPCGVTIAA